MIQFNHESQRFHESVIYEGRTIQEHYQVGPDFLLREKYEELAEKCHGKTMNMIETTKQVIEVANNPSIMITLCALFAPVILHSNSMIKVGIAKELMPAMNGNESLSSLVEKYYLNMKEEVDDELIQIGLIAFFIGMVDQIINEYQEFKKGMRNSQSKKAGDELDKLLRILSGLMREGKKEQKKTPDFPDLNSPEKRN